MTVNYRVNLEFSRYSGAVLSSFASGVVLGLSNNPPTFPHLPVTIAEMEALVVTLDDKLALMDANGGKAATAAKNAAMTAVVNALRKNAAYVQAQVGDDLEKILSSGYLVNSTNRSRQPLATPLITNLTYGNSGEMVVNLSPVVNARSYIVEKRTGTGDWQSAAVTTKARNTLISDLTSATLYSFRARAVGGSTGFSLWSDPVAKLAV